MTPATLLKDDYRAYSFRDDNFLHTTSRRLFTRSECWLIDWSWSNTRSVFRELYMVVPTYLKALYLICAEYSWRGFLSFWFLGCGPCTHRRISGSILRVPEAFRDPNNHMENWVCGFFFRLCLNVFGPCPCRSIWFGVDIWVIFRQSYA